MPKPEYYISDNNEFVIENYNRAPAFSSFFPGIAGIYGCPMWVFYANRGQCIASAGVHDKDGSIIEFQPANKAYRSVSLNGFRTFLKVEGKFYEPFGEQPVYKNEMRITPDNLKLVEENPKLNLRIEVNYFTIPDEQFPALARHLKIINLSGKQIALEVIDGLPTIIPYGLNNDLLKRITQTTAAWVVVENLENKAPFYKLKVSPADVSETQFIKQGNFFIPSWRHDGKAVSAEIIVDPSVIFGQRQSLVSPDKFIRSKEFKLPAFQQTEGIMPGAFALKKAGLKARASLDLFSIIGQADSLKSLNKIRKKVLSPRYIEKKFLANKKLTEDISSFMEVNSAKKSFDLYSKQTFLDNTMRGGFPVTIGDKTLYVYYRKHGDMERDYNDFKLMPTYFSQGTGNYRDINQNRRNDIFFNPRAGNENILRFFNLIQLDGYNPLVVLGRRFQIKSTSDLKPLVKKHIKNPSDRLWGRLAEPFMLGSLLKEIEVAEMEYKTCREDFAKELVEKSAAKEWACHGEGFWIDHFSYNTDLLESFECVYPEKINDLLFNQKIFTFFDNDHIVSDRKAKYYRVGDKIRQYGSVKTNVEKAALLSGRGFDRNIVRTNFGKGQVYQTTLLVKILCLAANKAASFDPEGIGLEMEADKPDWYDALNGLPALCGSSLSETLELKRICAYVLDRVTGAVSADAPVEIKEFMDLLGSALDTFFNSSDSFSYWNTANQLKEDYRRKTRLGVSGQEVKLNSEQLASFLSLVIKKCDNGLKKCLDKYNNYFTYFINERGDKFCQKPLPLFLEGFVHALKTERDKNIYKRVKESQLYDKKLKMYKVNSPLKDTPVEIGRARIFIPGWLENESIWLHMEYKYMLELLKAGLYQEFFSESKNFLVPFLDPEIYGRSILENSSFIVSSAHPNKDYHGRGFYARLSGASAEFIDMWLIMMTGKRIFYLDKNGKLCFKLSPKLPAWLFDKGQLSFKLLGSIDVTYLNQKGKDTFGNGVKPAGYILDDKIEIQGAFIPEPYAPQIRELGVRKITVNLL